MKTSPVQAVAGIIRNEGRILLTRRPAEAHLGGLWEFPGGKIEAHESPQVALAREIEEELGLEIQVERLYLEQEHAYPDRRVHLRFFDCTLVRGVPVLRAASAIAWVKPGDLKRFAMPEANRSLIEALMEAQKREGE